MKVSPALSIIIVLLSLAALPAFGQYVKLRDYGSPAQGTNANGTPVTDGTFLYGTAVNGGTNGFGVVYKVRTNGANFSVIHHFDKTDGSAPYATLTYDGSALYGQTYTGGEFGQGTIFKLDTDGSNFTTLLDFQYFETGGFPLTPLISDGSVLFGATTQGGAFTNGTVFKINKDGTGHTKLFEFNGTNGASPQGNIVYDGTYIYGLNKSGGTNFAGTVYRIKPDGTGFETLVNFNGTSGGFSPLGGLSYDGTFLWGTASQGGANSRGTLFRLLPDGTGYQTVTDFNGTGNGAFPKSPPVFDGTFLYGTTMQGGAGGRGVLYRILPNATGFVKLADLNGDSSGDQPEGTMLVTGSVLYGARSQGGSARVGSVFKIDNNGSNQADVYSFEIEGYDPVGDLVSDGTFLYGVTNAGGHSDNGTIYKVKPDGTGFLKLFDFEGLLTGGRPMSGLCIVGSTLYGMTSQGGTNDVGALYSIDTDGTDFTKRMDFDMPTTGGFVQSTLISDGTFLYGMTASGGANSGGTIFKILPNGTGYTKMHDFSNGSGQSPFGSLILDGGVLYGMTSGGGDDGLGVVFSILTDGDDYFDFANFDYDNGAQPRGTLYSDGTFLYGITSIGGANSFGNIFKVKKDGSAFQALKDFDDNTGGLSSSSFISDGTYLYAVTPALGVDGMGTLFRIKPDGTGFDKLIDFNDGSGASMKLFSDGTFLYGTNFSGGKNTRGTLFKRSLADHASITKFSPEIGAPGTYVTIYGNDFNPGVSNNTVTFNGQTATLISATNSEIVALVPDGATEGPISITSIGTDTSIENFIVTGEAEMFDGGTVKTCDILFTGILASDDAVETFVPGVGGGKIRVTFTDMDIDDELEVYDGPSTASPLVATLSSGDTDFEYTSTAPGGELTFRYVWQDSSSDWEADIECVGAGTIVINSQPDDVTTCINMTAAFSTSASGANNITYQWQVSDDGIDWDDISNGAGYSNATTSTLSVNTTGNFGTGEYRARVNGDGVTEVVTNSAELILLPALIAPCCGGLTEPACGPLVIDLTVSGGTDGQYRWYTEPTGGTAIAGAVNGTFTTPSLAVSTEYYVANVSGLCESARIAFSVSVKTCDLVVYNAVSPNGDDKNEMLLIENIEQPATQSNVVKIYNRWGDEVFTVSDYNNSDRAFKGINKNGNKLPSGTYFYKVTFPNSSVDDLTGYLLLKN